MSAARGPFLRLGICLGLVVLVLVVYGQVLGFDFVDFDDRRYVTNNPQVTEGLTVDGVRWAFTTGYFANWSPLTWLSHMFDAELFGLEPAGHHATSVLFHAANAVILFSVLLSMTGSTRRSAFVAALFAVHPLHVESVAWISERKDVLSTFFGLLSMGCYAAWARRGGVWRYLATALLLALGLMAKPMLVTLPLVFLLLDHWPLERSACASSTFGRRVVEKLPLLALSAVSCAVTLAAQGGGGAMERGEALPLHLRLANAVISYATYLRRAFWPDDLSVLYPHPYLPALGGVPPAAWQVAGAAGLLLALTALVAWSRRGYALVGWLWFLGMLTPVIGLLQVGVQGLADRYAYLSIVGVFVALTWGAGDALTRLPGGARRAAAPAAAAVLLAFAAVSWSAARHWHDSITLFARAVELDPRNAAVQFALAEALGSAGRPEESVRHYRAALEVAPSVETYNNLGNALRALGQADDAEEAYRLALALQPHNARTHNNLGSVLRSLGRRRDAVDHFRRALFLDPDYFIARYNLGNVLRAQGELEAAAEQYRRALRVRAEDPRVLNSLGATLQDQGRLDEAIAHYRRALASRPEYAKAHMNLGIALQLRGDLEAAMLAYREALRLDPDYARARNNLGTALHAAGRLDEAIVEYRRALEADPDHSGAQRNLEEALAERGAPGGT